MHDTERRNAAPAATKQEEPFFEACQTFAEVAKADIMAILQLPTLKGRATLAARLESMFV